MPHYDTRPWQRSRFENQDTQPLPCGNLSFRMYLSAHHLSSLDVARMAGVRYFRVWNIEQNIPIRSKHAALVRAGLRQMTGVAYTGPIVVHPDAQSTYREPTRDRRRHDETV